MVSRKGDATFHRVRPLNARGLEVFEIKPVLLGGSPTDPANKALVTRREHIQLVRYWNGIIAGLRKPRCD